jgi:hypothetical protein
MLNMDNFNICQWKLDNQLNNLNILIAMCRFDKVANKLNKLMLPTHYIRYKEDQYPNTNLHMYYFFDTNTIQTDTSYSYSVMNSDT